MNLTQGIWAKAAAVAVAGGTAFALFGGGAVHTQFSASTQGNARVQGASVALQITSNAGTDVTSDNGRGNFICSDLVPGATSNAPFDTANNVAGYCTETLTITNTGNVTEDLTITLSNLVVNNGGVEGTTNLLANLDQVNFAATANNTTVGTGTLAEYYNSSGAAVGQPIKVGYIGAGQSLPAVITLTLAASDTGTATTDNAWNGADVSIPFTVTATAGS
jgi:hypothetical protein